MMCFEFETRTHGKWILAGEHAVLRDKPAVVFPLKSHQLILRYDPRITAFSFQGKNIKPEQAQQLFIQLLALAEQLLKQKLDYPSQHFQVISHLPIGVGMGASAALCCAVSHFLVWQQHIENSQVFQFAQSLEHYFHGTSSGLDIAACLMNNPFVYEKKRKTPLTLRWQPIWYLSSCNQSSDTAACIDKVNHLWQQNPAQAESIDVKMANSANAAAHALTQLPEHSGLTHLAKAIDDAHQCFEDWGLLNKQLSHHISALKQQGAIAAKPTGSGAGGYVLSLWAQQPCDALLKNMIRA